MHIRKVYRGMTVLCQRCQQQRQLSSKFARLQHFSIAWKPIGSTTQAENSPDVYSEFIRLLATRVNSSYK